jgi:hypothetical protein
LVVTEPAVPLLGSFGAPSFTTTLPITRAARVREVCIRRRSSARAAQRAEDGACPGCEYGGCRHDAAPRRPRRQLLTRPPNKPIQVHGSPPTAYILRNRSDPDSTCLAPGLPPAGDVPNDGLPCFLTRCVRPVHLRHRDIHTFSRREGDLRPAQPQLSIPSWPSCIIRTIARQPLWLSHMNPLLIRGYSLPTQRLHAQPVSPFYPMHCGRHRRRPALQHPPSWAQYRSGPQSPLVVHSGVSGQVPDK